MSLQDLRKLRRPVIRVLAPLLAAAWISTAAAPCMAMTSDGQGGQAADVAHAHHAVALSDTRRAGAEHAGPGCPHCGPSSSHDGDGATHARCASGGTAVVKDAGAKLAKRDLAVGSLDIRLDGSSLPVAYFTESPSPGSDPPWPSLPRHLRFCVFLN
ncbi:MAG TPA: hypothetical protein VLD39_07610 [Gammaproteobacteria bacterium]|nr:hypothetical protein [Gammaproteobacteria bacterium]